MFGKERFCKINQIGDDPIVCVCPKGSKFKTVARALLFGALCLFRVADMAVARGVAVIFGMRSVGNDKDLHIFKQSAFRLKTVALVAVDLIECFPYCHAATFEFDMNEGETVYKYGNVVAVFVYNRRMII